MEHIPPPYEDTECKGCGTKEGKIFLMPTPRDDKDYYCKNCVEKELEERASV